MKKNPLSLVHVALSAAVVAGTLSSACAQDPSPPPGAHEVTGEAKAALNDPGCFPAQVKDSRLGIPALRCSKKAQWGTTTAACPDQAVYELDASTGWWWPHVEPTDPITAESLCTLYSASVSVTATTYAGQVVDLGSSTAPYKWDARTSTCYYADTNPYDHLPNGPVKDGFTASGFASVTVVGEVFWTSKGIAYSIPSKVTLECIDI